VNGRPDGESERGPEAERDRWGGRNSSRPKAASFRFALPTGQRETDGNSNCRSRIGIIVAEEKPAEGVKRDQSAHRVGNR
jgi:hypothetical protein